MGGFVLLREVAKGLSKYQPDLIVSVHPLMQHIPLRVLRARGLLHKIPFTTVITDLSTCHPTWYDTILLLEWPWSFGRSFADLFISGCSYGSRRCCWRLLQILLNVYTSC